MSILIRGMEMPENCMHCLLGFSMNFGVLCELTQTYRIDEKLTGRPPDCPLLPLPEKHGRLIDADELDSDIFRNGIAAAIGRRRIRYTVGDVRELLQHAPTIIPQSERRKHES